MAHEKLRIGYVPEHFSTPLHFAYDKFGLNDHATMQPFPSGTGTMIEAFKENTIDVGIGLTEAWVAGLAKDSTLDTTQEAINRKAYHIICSYTESPLRWALSTGANRTDVNDISELSGKIVGISRLGSGSHIMASVLASQRGWPLDFPIEVCGPFVDLRAAVKSGRADYFMWEHFTTKKYYDDGILKKIGEIPTPWAAWHITARTAKTDDRVTKHLLPALRQGKEHFNNHKNEAIEYICSNMEYSKADATEWYDQTTFSDFNDISQKSIQSTIESLKKVDIIDGRRVVDWQAVKGQE